MILTRIRAAIVLLAATGAIAVAGCGSSDTKTTSSASGSTTHAMGGHSMGGSSMQGMTALEPGADGTTAAAAGLTLKPATTTFKPGASVDWSLQVVDQHGMPVTKFDRDQTKLMHLIVVSKDLARFQHLHPVLGSNGRFAISVRLPEAGGYRAIADFATGGKRYALGTTITAPGSSTATPLAPPSTVATTDGYSVQLGGTSIQAGKEAQLTFAVARGGAPVSDLQPYLGAFGHLVAISKSELAYSHVHPVSHKAAAGTVTFAADFEKPGTYRLFLQFRAAGAVHTAPFTVLVK